MGEEGLEGSSSLQQQKMIKIHNIPKRKKTTTLTAPKRSQSDTVATKQTKRKSSQKKQQQNQGSTLTLTKTSTKQTLKKFPKMKKDKQQEKSKSKQKSRQKSKGKLSLHHGKSKKKPLIKKEQEQDFAQSVDSCQCTLKKFQTRKDRLKEKQKEKQERLDRLEKQELHQKQEELTQRKKIHMEYFMYKDVCLPIENTEQRKIIYKIKLIDESVERNSKPKRNDNLFESSVKTSPTEIMKRDIACQNTDRQLQISEIECQTEMLAVVVPPFESQNMRYSTESESEDDEEYNECSKKNQEIQHEKCLAQTLSELQFLYLPDDKNFTNFSRSEKIHYKELLLFMAKKFDEPEQILDESKIQSMLQQRYMKQRSQTESYPKNGIPTHTATVISYVSNLFCFLQIHQKISFLDRINSSYGYTTFQKLKRVKAGLSTKLNSPLISKSTFLNFETQLHQGLHFDDQEIGTALHAHNRAIFDAVNQCLLEFQPYYSSQGEPFPWSYNFQTTFYSISEYSYGALVCQVKDKIWQICSTLAGVLLEIDRPTPSKIHFNRIIISEQQMLNMEISRENNKVELDQQRTRILCEISEQIYKQVQLQILEFFTNRHC